MCKYFLYSCNCLWVTQCHVCILLKERIFFLHVYPQLSFLKKTWFVSFYLSPPPLFFSKTCFVFPIFIGGEIFFNLCGSQGELLLFIGGVVSISLTLLRMFSVYLLIRQSLSIRDKKGERYLDENLWESCLFCLGGVEIVFLKGGEYKIFLMYLTQGESQFTFVFYILFHIIVYMSFFPHMR